MNGHAFFFTLRARTLGIVLLIACAWVGYILATAKVRTVTVAITEHVAGRTVLIDPGHGGRDPGAVAASGLLEKDITLGVALHLERLLQRAAVNVVMTRRDDRDLSDANATSKKVQDLSRRVALGKTSDADVFISIHGNSFPSPAWSGAQTFHFPNRSDDKWLAEKIQERLRLQLGPNRRQAAAADYYVLRESAMPSVVVEVGFLSHPRESELLGTQAYQMRVAEAIYMGIIDYFALPRPVEVSVPQAADPVLPTVGDVELADDEVLLYFASPLTEGLAATVYRLPRPSQQVQLIDRVRGTLGALLIGPDDASGLMPVIPQGVTLSDLRITDGTVFLDFDARMREAFTGGAREERLIVDSVLLTLAQFPELNHVRISIGGEEASSIGGHISLGGTLAIPRTNRP